MIKIAEELQKATGYVERERVRRRIK